MPRRKMPDAARKRCARACENCKRRKQRCDGAQPCGRCQSRGVNANCVFKAAPYSSRPNRISYTHFSDGIADTGDAEMAIERFMNPDTEQQVEAVQTHPFSNPDCSSATTVPHLSRLIRDAKGKFMFIGDSANLSLLQNIRRLVQASIGTCAFVADPLRYLMVEDTPEDQGHWLDAQTQGAVPKPTLMEATELVRQYFYATNCVLDLFDECDLVEQLPTWLDGKSDTTDPLSTIYYLVLAIGAQTSPADKDEIANSYFNYGRYLTMRRYMENPSIITIQAYALITMFMLGASRRNAAFMNLGIAVRAAYALGLHKREISDLFPANEGRTRERLWKVIRILDLFMSASLGRPPSTSETRDTTAKEGYSASASLCAIFETIYTDIYNKRMVSTEVVEAISEKHRQWTARLSEGLRVDHIQENNVLSSGTLPNIGLYHVKEAYYWTIILLTRPFLVNYVSSYITNSASNRADGSGELPAMTSNQPLVNACVESAVRTIELLQGLNTFDEIPKRLPFVVNSLFVSALVIGVAFFGDLDRSYPLNRTLKEAQTMLRRFHRHDAIAKRNLMIVEYLEEACNTYTDKRDRQKMEGHSKVVGGIFGCLHDSEIVTPQSQSRRKTQCEHGQLPLIDPPVQDSDLAATSMRTPEYSETQSVLTYRLQTNNQYSTWIAPENEDLGYAVENSHNLHQVLDDYQGSAFPFAPQTLWFDSYEDNLPLFSTLHTGDFGQALNL